MNFYFGVGIGFLCGYFATLLIISNEVEEVRHDKRC